MRRSGVVSRRRADRSDALMSSLIHMSVSPPDAALSQDDSEQLCWMWDESAVAVARPTRPYAHAALSRRRRGTGIGADAPDTRARWSWA